jgi:hypothetical protein
MNDLERKFYNEMKNIYIKADRECGYRPTRFLQMLSEKGGVETAKSLIKKPGGTEGFEKLCLLGRLDLSIEALVIKEEFKSLFTDEDIKLCREKLKEYGNI